MLYADAVVWLAEYAFYRKLLVAKFPGPTGGPGPIATRLVEVPQHPPRLPFGLGSRLDGFPQPSVALEQFESWLKGTNTKDFNAARAFVLKHNPQADTGRWPERAAWVRSYVHGLEVRALIVEAHPLASSDPWSPYLPRLCPTLQIIASRGCLAFGTRTSNMLHLVEALTHLVDRAQAKLLLRHWVEHRDHYSDDINSSIALVLAAVDDLVDNAFKKLGIPESIWLRAATAITNYYKAAGRLHVPLSEDECKRAAFYIMQLFYAKKKNLTFIVSERFGRSLELDNIGGIPTRRPNKERVPDVRQALINVRILAMVSAPVPPPHTGGFGKAGVFELLPPYWPPPFLQGPLRYHP